MGRIGASALIAAFPLLFGACSLSDSVSPQEASAEERLIEVLASPEEIDGIPVEAFAAAGDDLWVGFNAPGLADLLCDAVDGYGTGDEWVLALGDGTVTLPEAIFSDSETSLVRFLFLARAIESTSYCPTSAQSDMMGSIVDSIAGLGEAVGDAFEADTTTTVFVSDYTVPTDAAAAAWAESAVTYAEGQDWRWKNREDAANFYATYASTSCRLLVQPSYQTPLGPRFVDSHDPAGQRSTPVQVEARLRDELGLEAWESFGQAWYDSLVNGLCVRR